MKLFVNEKKVTIRSLSKKLGREKYDRIIDTPTLAVLLKCKGKVLVLDPSPKEIKKALQEIERKDLPKIQALVFAVNDKKKVIKKVFEEYKLIEAAGGVVEKKEKILFIFRRKKWDLPKGKVEKKEGLKEAASREVEEECGVKVKVKNKLVETLHTYSIGNKKVLKKTYWYTMKLVDDKKMKPQKEEDIEKVAWLNEKEVKKALKNSYLSIQKVVKTFKTK